MVPVTFPWRKTREMWREKRKVRIFGKGNISSSPIVRIFGKGKCKFIANFSATMVTSLPSISLSLYLSLSLSPKVPHAQYRKRFRASYNDAITGSLTSVKGYPLQPLCCPVCSASDHSGQARSVRECEEAGCAREAKIGDRTLGDSCAHVRERPRSGNVHSVTHALPCAAALRLRFPCQHKMGRLMGRGT